MSPRPVLIVVAVIAVVMIVVLAFLVLAPNRPTVQLAAPYSPFSGSSFLVNVTSVSQAIPVTSVRVNLIVGGVSGQPAPLARYPYYPGVYQAFVNISAVPYTIALGDMDNSSSVTAGDFFEVVRGSGSFTGPVTFRLLWSDGYVVASATYASVGGGGPPVITLSASEPTGPNGFRFSIAGASQSRPIASFRVAFLVNSTASDQGAQVLASSLTFTVGGSSYNVQYTDVGSEGRLTGGDVFTVTKGVGDLTAGTTYQVLILWSDGSQLAGVAYAT